VKNISPNFPAKKSLAKTGPDKELLGQKTLDEESLIEESFGQRTVQAKNCQGEKFSISKERFGEEISVRITIRAKNAVSEECSGEGVPIKERYGQRAFWSKTIRAEKSLGEEFSGEESFERRIISSNNHPAGEDFQSE
jgi:hypothetical protein